MSNVRSHHSVVLVSTFLLTGSMIGCGASNADNVNRAARGPDTGAQSEAGSSARADRNQGLSNRSPSCSPAAVYFAFDSSDLDDRGRDQLAADAKCVQSTASSRVTVTGMADERGTEEYNLALGEKRARAVKSYMTSLGVGSERLDVRSVGEEYSSGSDESSWARDRRAELELNN